MGSGQGPDRRNRTCDGAEHRRPSSGPEGDATPLFLPHLAGSLAPWRDPASRGAFVGLTLRTTREELHRAVLEGITFELRLNLERCPMARPAPAGPQHRGWLTLARVGPTQSGRAWGADRHDGQREPGCLGAAILAGLGAGLIAEAESRRARGAGPPGVVEPDPSMQAHYRSDIELYRELYPAIRRVSAAL